MHGGIHDGPLRHGGNAFEEMTHGREREAENGADQLVGEREERGVVGLDGCDEHAGGQCGERGEQLVMMINAITERL